MGAKVWVRSCLVMTLAACGMAAGDEIERRVRAAEQSLQVLRFAEAEEHLLAALALPVSAEARAVILNNLGFVYHESGRHPQAESCYQRAIDAWKQVRGADDLETILTINNLANHYSETRQFAKLARLGLESFVPRLSDQKQARRVLAKVFGNLGTLEGSKGNYAKAEAFLLEAVEIWKSEAPGGAELLAALNNLARLLEQASREDDALRYYSQAQQVAAVALSSGDHRMATLLSNVAALHFRAGRLDMAQSLFRRALSIAESSLGPEHPLVGQILCNYAVVLRARKKRALADEFEKRGLAILHGPPVNISGFHTIDASDLIAPNRK
jgi:tetratricopeptide (TPR) repeat protein